MPWIERVRTEQPLDASVGIDWGNPITRGLDSWLLPTSSGFLTDSGVVPPTVSSSRNRRMTPAGCGAWISGDDGQTGGWTSKNYSLKTDKISQILVVIPTGASAGQITQLRDSGGNINHAIYGDAGGTVTGAGLGFANLTSTSTMAVGATSVIALNIQNNVSQKLYLNGTLEASSLDTTGGYTPNGGAWLLPGYASVVPWTTGSVLLHLIFTRLLSDGEVKSLYDNPWQVFEKERVWVPVPVDTRPKTYIERTRTEQPLESGIGIDWSNPLTESLGGLFDTRAGVELVYNNKATNLTSSVTLGNSGIAADFSGTANQQYSHRPGYATTDAFTIFALIEIRSLSNYTAIIAKQATTTTYCPYEIRLGAISSVDGSVNLLRSNTNYKAYSAASPIITAKPGVAQALTFSSNISAIDTAAVAYVGNTKTALSQPWGSGTGAATDNGSPVWIGRRYDSAVQLDGKIYYIALFNRQLSDAEVSSLTTNPWQLFEKERIWVPVASGPTYTLTASSNSLGLSGQSATLAVNRNLVSVTGTCYLTGQAAMLGINRYLTSTAGSYSLVGQAPTLAFNHKLISNSGSYSLTGNASTLAVNRNLTSATGNYSLTGSASTLAFNRKLSVSSGSYSLTGPTVTLTYTPISGITYTLAASSIGFTLTGIAATLALNRKLSSNIGSFALAGTATTLVFNRKLITSSSTFTAGGLAAALAFSRKLPATTGAFVTTSIASTLAFNRKLSVATVSFSFTGQAGTLSFNRKLSSNSGTFALTSSSTSLAAMRKLISASSGYVLSGQTAILTYWYPTGLAYPNLSYGISLPNNNILVSIPPSISIVVSNNQINILG